MLMCSGFVDFSLLWIPRFFLISLILMKVNQGLEKKMPVTDHHILYPRNSKVRHIILDEGLFVYENPPDGTLNIAKAPEKSFGEPWPMPKSYERRPDIFRIDKRSFKLIENGPKNDLIKKAFSRIRTTRLNSKRVSEYPFRWKHQEDKINAMAKSTIRILSVTLSPLIQQTNWPHKTMSEMYNLIVNTTGVYISAQEVWGVLRGLETFAQLIWATQSGKMFINGTIIYDQPRFKHRGLLVDTARNFITKPTILKMLDAMSMNKMNVFHWHIVDDQSFPYQSTVFPNLSEKGSFDPNLTVYSVNDVKQIVEYARLRGIRIIPEFDTPGHARSWGYGYPDLLTPCFNNDKWNGFLGPINPARNSTYRFLYKFFSELISVFKDEFIHLGGDEVDPICWLNSPEVDALLKNFGIYQIRDVIDFYFRRLQNIITKAAFNQRKRRQFVVWEEIFTESALLKKGSTVQVWKAGSSVDQLRDIANQSYDIIFSSCWYADRVTYGSQWVSFYECDPTFKLDEESWASRVIGGEACVWTEYMSDTTILSRTWPLASATAERLWSPSSLTSPRAAASRLEEHRCRMIRNGIPNSVASGPGLCRSELIDNHKPSQEYLEESAPESLLSDKELRKEKKYLLSEYKFGAMPMRKVQHNPNAFYYTKLRIVRPSYSLSVTYFVLLIFCMLISLMLLAVVTKCARVSVIRDLRKLPRRVRLFLSSLIPVFLFAVGLLAWGLNGLLFSIYSLPSPYHL